MHFPKFFIIIFTLHFLIIIISVCKSQDCANPPTTILVDPTGNETFNTIQSAIDSVPLGNSQWIHIQISPGTYKEKVKIRSNKRCIYLEGAGRNCTSIEWDDHGHPHSSPTFTIAANNTIAKGISFKNTYNIIDESRNVVPAVAVRVHADKCAFIDCGFIGVQDTLFDSYGRHYYHNCYIQGATDFIFGRGQSIFEASEIYFSVGLGPKRDGVITANERSSTDDPSAFVLKNCTINGIGGKTQLGRALELGHPRVIIANSFLADVIRPEGWGEKAPFIGHEAKITFEEVGCTGPGAKNTSRVPWINKLSTSELNQFLNISFIDKEGWIIDLPLQIST
ncbi:hypothetical protein RIF29_24787 [Crotalaria pallida]|uniref:Pectinesterase n=1 Tax=Crotalaria pallida TaxID=3830 RepID=A0AAN9EKC4_CROPI